MKRKAAQDGPTKHSKRLRSSSSAGDVDGDSHRSTTIVPTSVFEQYIVLQRLVAHDTWQSFIDSLKTPLPVTFRINRSVLIESDGQLQSALEDGNRLMHSINAKYMSWCNGWELPCDTIALKQSTDADLKVLARSTHPTIGMTY
jgi:hypothetical protein